MKLRCSTKTEKDYYASIYLDNHKWGVLPRKALHSFFDQIVPSELDENEAHALIELLRNFALEKLLDYLAKFERCTYLARSYLQRYGFDRSIIDYCIGEALAKGFVDDNRFAEIYIRSFAQSGKSRKQISTKLRTLQIPLAVFEQFLDEYLDKDNQILAITEEINKLLHNTQGLAPRKRREKILGSLYRKGFEISSVMRILDQYDLNSDL